MSEDLDSLFGRMWRTVRQWAREEAQAEITHRLGSNLRGGKLDGGAIGGSQSVPPSTLPLATTSTVGAAKPDGTTITVSAGTYTAATATTTTLGVVKPDNSTLTVNPSTGVLSVVSGGSGGGSLAGLGGDSMLSTMVTPLGQTDALTEVGRWVRSSNNPILSPSLSYENTSVQEPTVIYENGTYRMWYTAGWVPHSIALAECTTDPTDPANWTKKGSCISAPACHFGLFKHNGTYYCYYDDSSIGDAGNLLLATSSTGNAGSWTVYGTVIAYNLIGGNAGWANSYIWVEGSTWYMYLDGRIPSSYWTEHLFSSSDGLSWTHVAGPLTSLQVHSGGTVGSLWLMNPPTHNGLYHGWYHATPGSGVLPTNIYHVTSPDKQNWTLLYGGAVLTYTGIAPEVDQVADPSIIEVDGKCYMFYDAEDNSMSAGHISVAVWNGTIAQLIEGQRPIAAVAGGFAPLDGSSLVPVANLPVATTGAYGVLKPDGTSITITGGVISGTSGSPAFLDGVSPLTPAEMDDGSDWAYHG